MKYFNKLYKHICYIYNKRTMSSFKLSLWEDFVFVNLMNQQGDNARKLMISMLVTINKPRPINLCRSPNDTINTFIDRLSIKLKSTYGKKNIDKPNKKDISVKVNDIIVSPDSTCGEVFDENKSNITLQIKDNIFKVIVNAPIINDLKLGTPPYKGLMLYPFASEKGYNVSILDSKYLWYRVVGKEEIEVGNQITYIPTADDVNYCLKLVCKPYNEKGQVGPTAEILSSQVLENNIEIYPYENRLKNKPVNGIRVVSYNILATEYTRTKEAKHEMYPYCSLKALASSYRNPLILKELQAYNADIICLQEMDSNFFNRELKFQLKMSMGLEGIFLKKGGHRNEGLSCFYSPDKFILLKIFNIHLKDLTTVEMYCGPVIKDIIEDEFWKHALEKKTVLQVVLLQLITDKKHLFLICNTHLISDPEGDSIRLFQALIELNIINQIQKNIISDYPEHYVSVMYCGDFNSTPESGVFDLVTELLLPEKLNDVEIFNSLKNVLHYKMYSAYSTDVLYSNYTQTFSGLLDYIYFTDQRLELIQVLSMPPHDEIILHVGLPSELFPSDHLALIADFKVKT